VQTNYVITARYRSLAMLNYKNSLKIPKGQSEAVNQRMTDNTMAKKKDEKRTNLIYKTLHRKLKIEQHESK
jgi:hypothetical protein